MTHENRQIGMCNEVACDAPKDQFVQRAVGVGTHHQHVGADRVRAAQQRAAERVLADEDDMQLGRDAVLEWVRQWRAENDTNGEAGPET